YLVANRILPWVRVSHTLPVEEKYSFKDAAISDARVEIRLLDSSGEPEAAYRYIFESPGVYIPVIPAVVLPGRRYELYVTLSTDEIITAQTLVPGSFEIV